MLSFHCVSWYLDQSFRLFVSNDLYLEKTFLMMSMSWESMHIIMKPHTKIRYILPKLIWLEKEQLIYLFQEFISTIKRKQIQKQVTLKFCCKNEKCTIVLAFWKQNVNLAIFLILIFRCVVMVGLPYANIKSPELKEKMDYLNATMVSSLTSTSPKINKWGKKKHRDWNLTCLIQSSFIQFLASCLFMVYYLTHLLPFFLCVFFLSSLKIFALLCFSFIKKCWWSIFICDWTALIVYRNAYVYRMLLCIFCCHLWNIFLSVELQISNIWWLISLWLNRFDQGKAESLCVFQMIICIFNCHLWNILLAFVLCLSNILITHFNCDWTALIMITQPHLLSFVKCFALLRASFIKVF